MKKKVTPVTQLAKVTVMPTVIIRHTCPLFQITVSAIESDDGKNQPAA